jgi:NTP pyrophosphatase (non-canonical NTP hydrolase)
MQRPQITNEMIDDAFSILKSRMKETLERKGRGSFISTHEILGVITEENKELIDAVHQNKGISDELMDIAVAAIFSAACIYNDTLEW